jgi:hypothetical protein
MLPSPHTPPPISRQTRSASCAASPTDSAACSRLGCVFCFPLTDSAGAISRDNENKAAAARGKQTFFDGFSVLFLSVFWQKMTPRSVACEGCAQTGGAAIESVVNWKHTDDRATERNTNEFD